MSSSFRNLLEKYQKEDNDIPHYVIDIVKSKLQKTGYECKFRDIYKILSDENLCIYYDKVYTIFDIIYKDDILQSTHNIDKEDCVICFELYDTLMKLRCQHKLCEKCAYKLKNDEQKLTCPMCRDISTYIIKPKLNECDMKIFLENYDIINSIYVFKPRLNILSQFNSISL